MENKISCAAISLRFDDKATLFALSDTSVSPARVGLPATSFEVLHKRANSLIISILQQSIIALGATDYMVARKFALADDGRYCVVGACLFDHKKRKRQRTIREVISRALLRYRQKLSTYLLAPKDVDVVVEQHDKQSFLDEIEENADKPDEYIVQKSEPDVDYKALYSLYADNSPLATDEDIERVPTIWKLNNMTFIENAQKMRSKKILESVKITNKKTIVVCPSSQLFDNQRVAGVGKSYIARQLLSNCNYYLNSADKHGWDDYASQDVVFLDDLNPDKGRLSPDEWKQLTDKWNAKPTIVQSRYHNVAVVASKFVVTTPLPIEQFCARLAPDQGGASQIARRIDYCIEVSLDQSGNSIYRLLQFDDKTMTWRQTSDMLAKFIRSGNDVMIMDKDNQFSNLQDNFLS